MRAALFLLPFVTACGPSALHVRRDQEAARLDLMAYEALDGGAARAYVRGAYCLEAANLRDADAGVPEGGVQCLP